jgi:hypothetical protein
MVALHTKFTCFGEILRNSISDFKGGFNFLVSLHFCSYFSLHVIPFPVRGVVAKKKYDRFVEFSDLNLLIMRRGAL